MKIIEMKIEDDVSHLILCGGPYSNFSSLEALIEQTNESDSKSLRFCLGDIGGFGPHPDRSISLLKDNGFICIKGNYDHTVGFGEADCGCGYIDANDRKFSQISYDYTLKNTSEKNREWLRGLPDQVILTWKNKRILLCHGSPDEVNEFVFDSETKDEKIDQWLNAHSVDAICVTHSGIPWIRKTQNGEWVNVGVIGRPAHEGLPRVYFASSKFIENHLHFELKTLAYDATPVIAAMRAEKLPEEFCQSLINGEWTTCANILPDKERVIAKRI